MFWYFYIILVCEANKEKNLKENNPSKYYAKLAQEKSETFAKIAMNKIKESKEIIQRELEYRAIQRGQAGELSDRDAHKHRCKALSVEKELSNKSVQSAKLSTNFNRSVSNYQPSNSKVKKNLQQSTSDTATINKAEKVRRPSEHKSEQESDSSVLLFYFRDHQNYLII